jgi:hypothetical protein
LPQLAEIEKHGIPLVVIIYGDQEECFRQAAHLHGVPSIRTIHVSRTLPGPQDVDRFIGPLMETLVRPLTIKERETGRWDVPDKRVLFEGTLEEAEEFYSQSEIIPTLQGTPICKYTDGLPVKIPTEERVAAMLKGTSHSPDEIVRYQSDHKLDDRSVLMGKTGKKGDPVLFTNMRRTATVEKVAIIGVMAGCRPDHMPLLLAIAESGGGCGDGRGREGFVVSGPYAREIKMNHDIGVLGPGNPTNRSIGRAAELMWRNFGGNIQTVTNCGFMGNALSNCIPENSDALPPGWKGLNEEYDFKKNESAVVVFMMGNMQGTQFSPGGYRAFQKSGHGGIARRLGVKGKPGPHNWIEYLLPGFWTGSEGGITFLMLPEMAQHLYEYGFKSKDDVYDWLYKKSFMTVGQYRTHSWPDVNTLGWVGIEKTSGKHWKELPDDYMVPAMNGPFDNCVIVTGGGEELSYWMSGRTSGDMAYSIDAWR